jgi:hypothetical protein
VHTVRAATRDLNDAESTPLEKLREFLETEGMRSKTGPRSFADFERELHERMNGRAPAEADMETYFRVTPPSVHRMIVELERRGLIRRVPRQARSIQLCLSAQEIPSLRPQSIVSSVSRY